MSADNRALECEVMGLSSLDWRELDIVIDRGMASNLSYQVYDGKGKLGNDWKKERLHPT